MTTRRERRKWMQTTRPIRPAGGSGWKGARRREQWEEFVNGLHEPMRPADLNRHIRKTKANAVQRGEKRALTESRKRRGVRGKVGVA